MGNFLEEIRDRANAAIEAMDAAYNRMRDEDRRAKEAGVLVGRYYSEQIADGYAYYRVADVSHNLARLEHLDVYDAWSIGWIEDLEGEVPLKAVRRNIERRDRFEAFMDERRAEKEVK